MSTTIQIVNPSTGEIGCMADERTMPIELARNVADNLAARSNQQWDVVKIEILYSSVPEEKS